MTERRMGPGFGPGSHRELMQPDTFVGRPTEARQQHGLLGGGGADESGDGDPKLVSQLTYTP